MLDPNLGRSWSYFGLIAGLPPGVPGGGITGIVAPEGGGVCFIPGSTSAGGVTIPPQRLRSELVVPLAGGIQLDNGQASVSLTNPTLTLGTGTEGSTLSFSLNGGPELKLLDIDTSQLVASATPNGGLDVKGLLATLSAQGASSLNKALGTDAFTTGQPIGGITVSLPNTPPPPGS